jgi:hypothetical protein
MPGTILLERRLPLSWVLQGEAVTFVGQHNQLVFTLLDFLDEPHHHKPDTEHSVELMRIDAKLNIVMQLLGQLLQTRESSRPLVAIRFTSDTLAWQVEQPVPAGSLLQVTLSPDDSIPLAMTFTARVLGVSERWMEVDMHGLSEDELAIWSRWVFRQHRRQVAQARVSS